MSLLDLVQVIAPPPIPIESGEGKDWAEVENTMGTTLPDDYKQLIQTYGTGVFADVLVVLNPFDPEAHFSLIHRGQRILDGYRILHKEFPQYTPYEPFPEPDGILPWGMAERKELYWQTTGNPDEWPLVIFGDGYGYNDRFEMNVTGFLARLLSRNLQTPVFGTDFFPEEALTFVPTRSSSQYHIAKAIKEARQKKKSGGEPDRTLWLPGTEG